MSGVSLEKSGERAWTIIMTWCAFLLLLVTIPFGGIRVGRIPSMQDHPLLLAVVIAVYVAGGFGALWCIIQRLRHNTVTTWMMALIQLIVPTGPVMAFPLATYIRRNKRILPAIAAHLMGTALFVVRDLSGADGDESLIRFLSAGTAENLSNVAVDPFALAFLFVTGVFLPIFAGLWLRRADELESSREDLLVAESKSESLQDELKRKQERENLARELHDTIGHRLSLVNLYAGGLEVSADEATSAQARQVRRSAQEAVDDLRRLMTLLKSDRTASETGPLSFTSIIDVIESLVKAGHPVDYTAHVNCASEPEELVLACYRIVQELLTNATKHAPGETLHISVTGNESDGVTIHARNKVSGLAGSAGHGLAGIESRVAELDGSVTIRHGEAFTVHVWIPWPKAH